MNKKIKKTFDRRKTSAMVHQVISFIRAQAKEIHYLQGQPLPSPSDFANQVNIPADVVEEAYHYLLERHWLKLTKNDFYFNQPLLVREFGVNFSQLENELQKRWGSFERHLTVTARDSFPLNLAQIKVPSFDKNTHYHIEYLMAQEGIAVADHFIPSHSDNTSNESPQTFDSVMARIYERTKFIRQYYLVVNLPNDLATLFHVAEGTALYQIVTVALDSNQDVLDVAILYLNSNFYFGHELDRQDVVKLVTHHFFYKS